MKVLYDSTTRKTIGRFAATLVLAVLMAPQIHAATYFSRVTGNWSTNTTWSATSGGAAVGSGIYPVAGDIVYIEGGFTVTVDANSACASIQMGHTGATASAGTLTFANSATLTVSGAVLVGNNISGSNGTITFTSGSTLIAASLTLGGSIAGANGTITMTAGGTLSLGGAITLGTGTKTWTPGTGTVIFTATNTLPANIFTSFNNLTINGGTTTTGSALIVNGTLTVGTGATFATGATNTWYLRVAGSSNISGTLTLANTGYKRFTGDITLNSGAVWSETAVATDSIFGSFINNATTFSPSTGTHYLSGTAKTISGTTINSIPAVSVSGTYTNNGTLTVTTTISGAGTLTNASTLNISSSCSLTKITNTGTVNLSNTGTVTTSLTNFTNTGTVNISGSGTITGLTNNAAGVVNHSGSSTITSFSNATATSRLNISTTPTVPTITTLTVTAAGNTVNYNGAGDQTVKAASYKNLIFSGSGVKSMLTGTSATTSLSIAPTGTAKASIATGIVLSAATLTLGGTLQSVSTYGSTSSAAASKNDTYFAATTGILEVGVRTSTAAGGTWSTATTWLSGVVPAATDNVVIATTGAGVVTVSATTTCYSLLVNSGATITLSRNFTVTTTTTVSGTLNFSASSTTSRTMTFTGDVTLNSGSVWTVPATGNGANNAFTFGGNFTNNATTFNDLGTGTHTFSGAAKTISGSAITSVGTLSVTGTVTNVNTLTVRTSLSGTGSLTNGNGTTGTLNLGGSASITGLTATAANNWVYYSGGTQTAKVTTYNNLVLSGTGIKTFSTTPTVNGLLSLEGTATVVVTTGVVTYGTNATLQYNTATARTTSLEEWITPFTATGGVIIANTGVITTLGAKVFNAGSPLTIQSGATFSMSNQLFTFNGDLINNGGTISGTTGGVTITGTANQNIGAFTTTGTILMSKTGGTATLTGNVVGGFLTINGSGGTLNLGTALSHAITNDVTLTAGTLDGGSSTLNLNAARTTVWNGTGSVFSANTGTVIFGAAGAQTISATATTFNNLTLSNSGLKTFSNIPTVNGILSMEGTATVSAAPTYGSNATLQYNTTTSRNADVEWITPFVASGGVVIGSTGTITMNAAKVFNATAPLIVNAGATLSMSSFLLTLNGNFINNGGTASGTTGGVTLTGTATQSIGAFTTTGTVSMTKTGGTATLTGNINGAALTINGAGGTLNLGTALTHTFTGIVTLTAGILDGGSSTLNENAISATAWNGTGSVFTAASGTVNFGAAGNQTIAANSTFNNLALSGSGNKTLANSTTIVGDLSIISSAQADLAGFTTHTAYSLSLDGVAQAGGSWGSSASTATHQDNTYFVSTINGMVNVNCAAPVAPTSGGNQSICSNATIPPLTVIVGSGETAYWYAQASGGTTIAGNTLSYTPVSAGTYYAGARSATGCASASRTAVTLTINTIPAVLSLTGNTICSSPGGNGTITSTTSQSGVNYQLYNSSDAIVQTAKAGTGSALSWTGLAAGTGYYVVGTNATTSCNTTSSTVNVSTYANPAALSLMGSSICTSPGNNGSITSTTSVVGVTYQLYKPNNDTAQLTKGGTGAALVWVNLIPGTGYYVISTDAHSCVSALSNNVNISTTANPTALSLTGSTICASPDGNGTISSTTSMVGINYQLYDNTGLEVGIPAAGTGATIIWDSLTAANGYYVVGINTSSNCISTNSSAVNITITPNPTITTSATAAAACYSLQNSTLSYSATTNSPTHYTITWNTAAHTAGLADVASTTLPSSPIPIPVATNVVAGTYTGTLNVFNDALCGSANNTFTLTVNTLPAAPTGSATQIFCSGATVANLSASGTSIAWYAAASGGTALSSSTALVNGNHYYATQTQTACESANRLDVTAIVVASGSWIGTTSTNWFTATNWCGGAIPTAATNVTIAAGLQNYPSVGSTGAVCNNITIASGATLTITSTNTLTVSGNWTNNGTFTPNTSTVNFNGAGAASISASNFYNVTFSGAGAKTATGALTIAGDVSITNNFTAGAFTHTVSGNWTNSGTFTATGSTIDFAGSVAKSIGASNFNNVTFSGAGTKTATGILTIAGNVSISNNFVAGAFTHTVGGDWTKSGTFNATGSTINFNGAGAGNIGASNFNHIIFSGVGTKTATGGLNIVGTITISNNFSGGSYSHTILVNWINNGTFTANTSTITFTGTSSTISGNSTTFNNLTLNESGGATLSVTTSVSGVLTLTNGKLDIGAYNLTINSTGSISGGTLSSYIKTSGAGRLKQTVLGNHVASKMFPIGNSAYNPMSVTYNDNTPSDNFSIRVADGTISNANSSKTVNRKWFLIKDAAGSADLTLAATYNSGEEGSGFNNATSPKIGYFDGTSWAYRVITSGSGTTTFTASGSAPDFTNTNGFFVLGSGDAFRASKFAVSNINPTNPLIGIPNTIITVQSLNSANIPTMVDSTAAFSLSATNTAFSSTPTGSINQYAYQTTVSAITFTQSTYNTGTSNYNHNATVTATKTVGQSLSPGTSAVFDVYQGAIYEPVATELWDASNGWRKSTDGGSSWTNPASLPASNIFANNDLIRIPAGITLTANVTASFYSLIILGTLDIASSGNLTLNHSSLSDYNIYVPEGTLKNSGGTLTNTNIAYPFEIHGGTYWHNMAGGSIPVCLWTTSGSTKSTCKVEGAGVGGLNQSFEDFTLTSGNQTITANMIISGVLTLTSGVITTNSDHLIASLSGIIKRTNGYINGNLRRYITSTTDSTFVFPVGDATHNAPVSITFAGTTSGSGYLDVSTSVVGSAPAAASGLSQSKYINRKWTITNNGVTGFTSYSPTFTFTDGDKVGTPATSSLVIRKLNGAWATTTIGARTTNSTQCTGLTSFADYYIAEDDCNSTNAMWLGTTNTDWNTTSNWCSGTIPTATTDVTIPSSPTHQPIIGSAGGSCKNITLQSGASLSISGAYTFDVKGNWSNSGTFTAGSGTVSFTGTVAQTIAGTTTFTNLTINNAAGVTAANNITVNGVLMLTSANPNATHGTLDMGSYTLRMLIASASVTGIGDVSGIVKRTHTFTPNTPYQFGSQFTTLSFMDLGTQPSEISCRIEIGSPASWKADACYRYYSFAQTGATGTDIAVINLRYLTSELHGNVENKLVLWDYHSANEVGHQVDEHGKTNNSTLDHWVGLSGLSIGYISPTTLGYKEWGLANYSNIKNTWLGADLTNPTKWDVVANWSGGHIPISTDDVLIPAGKTHYPTLTLSIEIQTLEIESGASVVADAYDITINGRNSAWLNNGTFAPGSGTVNFTHGTIGHVVSISGSTQFNDIYVAANTFFRPATGSLIQISGAATADPSSIVDLSPYGNTVEYNGSSAQTIVNPVYSNQGFIGYYNLIISGTGVKTLYDNQLDISGNFTNTTGTLDLSNATVSFIGTSPQIISGDVDPVFNDLTINNATGVTASSDMTVNGTLNLESDNPTSLDKGTLVMATDKILNLGDAATTTGIGDVSGIIKRTTLTAFATNTFYSFGNTNQGVTFPASSGPDGITSLTFKVIIGTAPSWGGTPINATNRIYEIAESHTGGTSTKAIVRLNYKDNELASGVNESLLAIWNRISSGTPTDKGWSNADITANYISISDVDLYQATETSSNYQLAIAPTSSSVKTWNGNISTTWNEPLNWTPNGYPTTDYGVIIPDANTTVNQPTLPISSESPQAACKYIIIQTNGILNSGASDGATLTITDGIVGDAWSMEAGGTFNAGNSTVIFTTVGSDVASLSGSTDFYNLTVSSSSKLRPAAGSYIGIEGTLTNSGTFSASTNENTIEFKGNSTQAIPNPNGASPGYRDLIFSGSGAKTFSGTIDIYASLTNNCSSVGVTNFVWHSETNEADVETIGGIYPTTFNNLTVSTNSGLGLDANVTVNGTLTLSNGLIITGTNRLIIGNSATCTAGTITGAGIGKYVYGNLRRYVSNGAVDPSLSFDIGDDVDYAPVTLDFTGTTAGCGYIDASTTELGTAPPVVSGLSQTKYIDRKWTLNNTGVSGFTSYSPTFTFVASDKVGTPDESALVVRKYNGSAWYTTTVGTRTTYTTQATDLTVFSDFEIGEDDCAGRDLWLGGTSTDWNTGSNWCSGYVPTSSDNVVIPSGTPYQPHIGSTGSGACKDITIYSGATLTMDGSYTLDIYGNWINNGTFTASTSTLNFTGTTAQTINGTTTFSTLKVNNDVGVTLGVATTVGTLTIGDVTPSSLFWDGGYQLTSTGTLNLASGTFKVGSGTSATTYPTFATNTIASGTTVDYGSSSEQTIAAVNYGNLTNTGNGNRILASSGSIGITGTLTLGSGSYAVTGSTVNFNGIGGQTVNGFTYNNLTISAPCEAGGDITIEGVINLNSANASSTKGALYMGLLPDAEYILYMGATATTTGTGDVNGYINRSSFALNTDYTFGNTYTKMNFTVGPLPSSITLEVYLASGDISWKPDAVRRYFDIVRSGGSPATRLRFNVHYLDSELNGATEGNLDLFDYHVSGASLHDHGRTDYNTTNNWVGFSNVGLVFLGLASADDHFWTLGTNSTNGNCTWIGGSPSGNTDWDLPGNWEGGVPGTTSHVIIPDVSDAPDYNPLVPSAALPDGSLSGGRVINTIDIQNGGILNATTGSPTLTISGSDNAWLNHGTFNAGTSTIVFTNAAATMEDPTYFYNVTVADGAKLILGTDNYMGIAGTLSLSSTGVLDSWTNSNTVDYNGGSQTVIKPVVPNGQPNYHNLVLSGSGVKTMPNSAMYLHGEFIMSGTTSATADGALTLHGTHSNIRLGSGTTFTAGNFTHSLYGNIENNGATFNTAGSTFYFNGTAAQTIGGTTASAFNNVIIDNSSGGVYLSGLDATINGTLTFTSGVLNTSNNKVILSSTGSVSRSSGHVYGNLQKHFKSSDLSHTFEIGDATEANYTPVLVTFTGVTSEGDLIATTLNQNHVNLGSATFDPTHTVHRTWTLTNSGIAFTNYDATFTWVTSDQDAGFASANATIALYNGSAWSYPTMSTLTTYSSKLTGASVFGDYQIGDKKVSLSGNVSYYNTANTSLANDVTVGLYSDANCTQLVTTTSSTNPQTTSSGAYQFNNLYAGTYYVLATSAAATDGAVNGTDAAQVNAWGVNPYEIEKVRFYAGDVKGINGTPNNTLSSLDAQLIMDYFVNGSAFDRSGAWTFWNAGEKISSQSTPPTAIYPSVTFTAGSDLQNNIYGLCTGDFNRSFVPGGAKSGGSSLNLIYTGTLKASSQQEFDLPIHIVNPNTVGAVSLILDFPADMVNVLDVVMNSSDGQVRWAVQGNQLRLAWFANDAMVLNAGDVMATLHLRTTAVFTPGNSIQFSLASSPANELADGQYDMIPNATLSIDVINTTTTNIQEQPTTDLSNINLKNYPNPFSGITTLVYELPEDGQVSLEVYNLMGTLVTTLVNETQQQGIYNLKFDANMLPSGIYVARLTLNNEGNKVVRNIKMVRN